MSALNGNWVGGSVNYSSDEIVVGKWVTGKPIYQKTFIDTVPNAVTDGTEVDKGIAVNASIDTVVGLKGVLDQGGSVREVLSCAVVSGIMKNVRLIAYTNSSSETAQRNTVHTRNSWTTQNGATIYITIQYTKTTD